MASPKYDLEKMDVADVEKQIDSILASLGNDATLKVLTAMMWKKQDELIAMEEAKEPVEKLAALDTEIHKWEELISSLVDALKCPPWCHNPYCDCRN
jgi:vesicle coat complex subunit